MTMEEHFRMAMNLSRIPNTRDARAAFYEGARVAMNGVLDHADDQDALTRMNDDLTTFGKATIDRDAGAAA